MSTIRKHAVALGVAGVLTLWAATPGVAVPLAANKAALQQAAPGDVIEVRHRRAWRGAPVAAFALGVLGTMAAAAAADAYYDRYHFHPYAHPHPYAYAYPYPYPGPYGWPYGPVW
jgi:hypothetical protein